MMVKTKRGAAMISFHWLMVIIAGGAIIMLFSMFINTAQQSSETSLSIDVLIHFDTIFSSLVTTEKTEANLPSRDDIDIEFTCFEDSGASSFRLAGGVSKDLDNTVLFSKDLVSGNEIFTVARNYATPFSVTSLLYVTDPNVLYVIDSTVAVTRDAIVKLLPRNATIIELGGNTESSLNFISQIELDEYRDVVVIAVSGESSVPTSLSQMTTMNPKQLANVYMYHVISSEDDFTQKGTVTGYRIKKELGQDKFTSDGSVSYDDDALLAGILMSEDIAWYGCVKEKLLSKVTRVSIVLAKRAELFSDSFIGRNAICQSIYGSAQTDLARMADIPQNAADYFTIIKQYNERLELQSCPLLY